MTCQHEEIVPFRLENGDVVMWACSECWLKFEPIRLWKSLTEEELCDVAQSLGVHVAGPASDAINALSAAIEACLKEKNK